MPGRPKPSSVRPSIGQSLPAAENPDVAVAPCLGVGGLSLDAPDVAWRRNPVASGRSTISSRADTGRAELSIVLAALRGADAEAAFEKTKPWPGKPCILR